MAELGSNVEVACLPGDPPSSPIGRMADRANLYLYARRIAYREVATGRVLAIHHVGPCSEQSPSLIGRLPVPFVYGPLPGFRPANVQDDEWLSWLRITDAPAFQSRLSKIAARRARPLARFLSRRTLIRADAITVESEVNAPGGNPNIVVIPPGIDVNQFSPRFGGQPVTGRIIAVGSLLARKGYDVLIRAVATVVRTNPSAHLLLVGSGPQEQSLRLLASQLGISGAITFSGNVPRADLLGLLHSAEIFCHPARWDTFPLSPLEAMASGLPTLVSSAGALPEIVGGSGIVHTVGDDAELARHLVEVLSYPTRRRDLGAAARARVVQHFTWQRMCDSYLELYQRLAKSRLRDPRLDGASSDHAEVG
jgi:glycosyltransferase involved in cell wall biosynthesis